MRAYLWTTGLIFALIVAAHLWRVVAESRDLARDPAFLLLTLLAALLVVWAGILLRRTAGTRA
jgi:hypothetical protein